MELCILNFLIMKLKTQIEKSIHQKSYNKKVRFSSSAGRVEIGDLKKDSKLSFIVIFLNLVGYIGGDVKIVQINYTTEKYKSIRPLCA